MSLPVADAHKRDCEPGPRQFVPPEPGVGEHAMHYLKRYTEAMTEWANEQMAWVMANRR